MVSAINVDKKYCNHFEGKRVGLALSGGGYRASFFHLGVLASLAERDLLKHISVLSTVSGGSIIGALYYLKLRDKILKKSELSLTDYIEIVQELEIELTQGVNKNIRSKVFLNPINEIRAVFQPREKILASLYKKYFYHCNLRMDQLKSPHLPKLVINTTNLANGGHWYFSQDSMGQYLDSKIVDSRGMISYEGNNIYLKDVVAASTAVPGLFNYLKFKINTSSYKLVDGGAFDNLGLFALEKEQCDIVILSDGSRQLTEEQLIPRKRLSVLKRSYDSSLELNKKLMLENCKNCFHIHLKENHPKVDLRVSDALSKLRTDLNRFTSPERKSLSYFAYLLTNDLKKYIQPSKPLVSNFDFKDLSNSELMCNPRGNFLLNLWNGSKLNSKGDQLIFFQALNQLKFFLATFLSIFLLLFYVAWLGKMGVDVVGNTVVISYLETLLYLMGGASIYLMLYSTLNDLIHYIDWIIAKVIHFVLTLFFIVVILATFLIIFTIIAGLVIKKFNISFP